MSSNRPASSGLSLDQIMANFRLKEGKTQGNEQSSSAVSNAAASSAAAPGSSTAAAPAAATAVASVSDSDVPHSVDEFLSAINRQLAILLDGSSTTSARKASFELLERKLGVVRGRRSGSLREAASNTTSSLLDDSSNRQIDTATGASNVPRSYLIAAYRAALKPLLKRFGDPLESCRSSAIQLVTESLFVLQDIPAYLHYIIPVLAYRMGTIDLSDAPTTLGANTTMHERSNANPNDVTPKENVSAAVALENAKNKHTTPASAEQSEDVRILLLSLLYELMIRCSNHELEAFLPDICQMIYTSLLNDQGPDLKILCCDVLIVMAEDYPQSMRAYSRILMLPLMQKALLHHLSRVRIAAIQAMGKLIPCGAAEQIRDLCAFREHNVIDIHGFFHGEHRVHYFAKLVADPNAKARTEFFKVINRWCLTLQERADYETLIMPYVLTGLSDPLPLIQSMALETMSLVGREYEKEEKERLASGVGGNAMDEGAFRLKLLAEEDARKAYAELGPPLLFPPFAPTTASALPTRPPWGERQIARKFLDRILYAMLSELDDWKGEVTDKSWSLLRVLLMYAEEHITQYNVKFLHSFALFLYNSELRHEKVLPAALWDVIALVGRYTDPLLLVENSLLQLKHASNAGKTRATLQLLAHFVRYMPHTHAAFPKAIEKLVHEVFISQMETEKAYLSAEKELFQAYVDLIAAVLSLQGLSQAYVQHTAPAFFRLLLEIAAWTSTGPAAKTLNGTTVALSATASSSHAHIVSNAGSPVYESLSKEIESCYTQLLHHIDEEEEELLIVFQMYLLPILQEIDSSLVQGCNDRGLEFGVVVETLKQVGAKGLFVQLPESNASLTTTQAISQRLQHILLALLNDNNHFAVHVTLLPVLANCLKSSATTFSAPFAQQLLAALLHRTLVILNEFPSRMDAYNAIIGGSSASGSSSSSLARLSREEEKQVEAAEVNRDAYRNHVETILQAVTESVVALLNKNPSQQLHLPMATHAQILRVSHCQPHALTQSLFLDSISVALSNFSGVVELASNVDAAEQSAASELVQTLSQHVVSGIECRQLSALRIVHMLLQRKAVPRSQFDAHSSGFNEALKALESSSAEIHALANSIQQTQ